MINLGQIKTYFPPQIVENPAHQKYMIKEYILLMILDFLASSKFIKKIIEKVDLINKSKDFEHLLFNPTNKEKVVHFGEFVRNLHK